MSDHDDAGGGVHPAPHTLPTIVDADWLCRYLRISMDTLQDLIDDDGLPVWHPCGRKPGARRLFHREAVEDWIREQSLKAARVRAKGQGGGKGARAKAKGKRTTSPATASGPGRRGDGSYDFSGGRG